MPSKSGPARTLLQPAPDFAQKEIPVTRQPLRAWFRIHRAELPAVAFATRPHHRFSHPDSPFPLLYVGSTIQTCLWEMFGDDIFQGKRTISARKWENRTLSQITVPELKVCAVSLEKTRDAMEVDKAGLLAADLTVPQAWGLAVQQHPRAFQALKYTSRFVDQPCLALFDRDGLAKRLKVSCVGPLTELSSALDWLHERKAALV